MTSCASKADVGSGNRNHSPALRQLASSIEPTLQGSCSRELRFYNTMQSGVIIDPSPWLWCPIKVSSTLEQKIVRDKKKTYPFRPGQTLRHLRLRQHTNPKAQNKWKIGQQTARMHTCGGGRGKVEDKGGNGGKLSSGAARSSTSFMIHHLRAKGMY